MVAPGRDFIELKSSAKEEPNGLHLLPGKPPEVPAKLKPNECVAGAVLELEGKRTPWVNDITSGNPVRLLQAGDRHAGCTARLAGIPSGHL